MPNFWSRTKNVVGNAYNTAKEKAKRKASSLTRRAYSAAKNNAIRIKNYGVAKAKSLTRRAYNGAKHHANRLKDYGVAKAKSVARRVKKSAIVKTLQMKIFNAGGHFMDSIVSSKYDSVGQAAKRLSDLKYELAQVLDDEETFLLEDTIIKELKSTYGALHPSRRSSTPSTVRMSPHRSSTATTIMDTPSTH